MTTELAHMKIFAVRVPEPGGAAIIFPKSGPNQITLSIKNLLLSLTSVVEISLRCTIFEFGIFCLQELQNNWYEKQKMLQNDVFKKYD